MKTITLALLSLITTAIIGQPLVSNVGAIIKVQAGATLYIEGGLSNTSAGTIENDGIIELKGDLDNQATIDASDPANIFKFSGDANATIRTNGSQLNKVVIQKGTTYNVTLVDPLTITNNLDFNGAAGTGNKLILGGQNLTLTAPATLTGADNDEYVMTNGAGYLKKAYAGTGTFSFPVGFDASTYNPATLNVTAGPGETYSVRVLGAPTDGNGLTGSPILTQAVNAVWDVQEMTVGGNTANLTLGWTDPGDELPGFLDASNAVSRNDGVNGWDALFADLGPENPTDFRTRNGITGFGAFAVGGKSLANDLVLNAKVFLQGPYNAGLMDNQLRVLGFIPTTEPYSAAPFNYVNVGYGGGESVPDTSVFNQSGTNNDIVDWIEVEIRDASNPATRLATRTALIQRDGDIVDLDALSPLKVKGLADGTYHVGLKHRNHLTVRTQNTMALSNTASILNFTTAGVAYDNGSTNNEPMADLGGGVMGLWGGDVDWSNNVAYLQGDRLAILNKVGTTTPSNLVAGYNREDATMNGLVGYLQGDRLLVLNVVGTTTPSKLVTAHQ